MSSFDPVKEDLFTFGLWTVGNPGRDPFGGPVRSTLDPNHIVRKLSECGAYGVNLHDNDLIPFGASATERDRIVREFKQTLSDTGMKVPMATTNLFTHPIFKDGAFTSNDPKVRAFALQKTMHAMDLGAELGAKLYVFWGGREGTEADSCRDPRDAWRRMQEAVDFLCGYAKDNDYGMRFALEAKPNEPRSEIYLPTTGHMLHFISTLENEEMVGVNPEVAHEVMAGLSFAHNVAQAMACDKLFHIDLNGQKMGRYDQDLRFGCEDQKGALLLIRLLEGTLGGKRYEGPRHFDAHAYRTEDEEGVWEFAKGCMRTYKILHQKALAFDGDSEVQSIIQDQVDAAIDPLLSGGYSTATASSIKELDIDIDTVAKRGLRYERLDQLMIEHLLGVRG